ncbi:hypothetical protein [Parasitella parasitica]|uniref:Uncharacterized protein n=1 Tax=Parasitella parasitica TaxID=35722 RepID=A0A0B7NHV3_9FUNG|nr:hypothetical protein [Parasitella parasitica]
MATRSLLIVVILAVFIALSKAAPANTTTTAKPSVIKTANVSLKTSQHSASKTIRSSASASKPTGYLTKGLPASIFPTNSFHLSDSNPLYDGLKTLSLQAKATNSA